MARRTTLPARRMVGPQGKQDDPVEREGEPPFDLAQLAPPQSLDLGSDRLDIDRRVYRHRSKSRRPLPGPATNVVFVT